MESDPFPFFEYLTQGQLGRLFGVSSHVIGRWLCEAGLRDGNKKPTALALDRGIVQQVSMDGACVFPTWKKLETVSIFRQAGHAPVIAGLSETADDPDPITLVGPFSAGANDGDGFEVIGGDGVVRLWVRGKSNAALIVRVMNLVDKFRKAKSHE